MENNDTEILEKTKLLWEEYRYRHELCWKLIFQTTAAVVIILIIPFIKTEIMCAIHYWIIAVPLIALAFLFLIYRCLTRELLLLQKIRVKYRELQKKLYDIDHNINDDMFSYNVKLYLVTLGLLSIIEVIIILFVWIPNIC